ncbi:His-Xaa-Ser system protein HxsD [Bartonella sp. M0177]|nr:His-Xaa-Ser system protein HxsD [Bartonella sp. M0177]
MLEFDCVIYSSTAIQKAAYRAMNFMLVHIDLNEEKIICICEPTSETDNDQFEKAIQEFKKDVLDYSLREKIRDETTPIRNLILGIAFSRTGAGSE